jgi:hypothetical protein
MPNKLHAAGTGTGTGEVGFEMLKCGHSRVSKERGLILSGEGGAECSAHWDKDGGGVHSGLQDALKGVISRYVCKQSTNSQERSDDTCHGGRPDERMEIRFTADGDAR